MENITLQTIIIYNIMRMELNIEKECNYEPEKTV